MIKLVKRTRIDVLADAPLCSWLSETAAAVGIVHHSVGSLVAGSGQGGHWRDEDVSGAVSKRMFIAIASDEKANAFIEAIAPYLDEYGLLVTMAEVSVVRGDRF